MERSPKGDIYDMWKETGQLPEILAFISDCGKKLVTMGEKADHLNIKLPTFTKLRKKHPDIQLAMDKFSLRFKEDLASAMYKLAMGYTLTEETQDIEDKGSGQSRKRKIHRTKKEIGPDFKTIVYLLTKILTY